MTPEKRRSDAPLKNAARSSYVTTPDAASIALIADVSREIGWDAAMQAVHAAGYDTADHAAKFIWTHPRWEEVQKARVVDHEPCGRRNCPCSRCTHADAWRRRGGRPYLGLHAERGET